MWDRLLDQVERAVIWSMKGITNNEVLILVGVILVLGVLAGMFAPLPVVLTFLAAMLVALGLVSAALTRAMKRDR